ncbi:MAG: S-layer homology domain-containing protein, partial [Clostridia bacterium]|nr:S-layer homology domain-containing protein [Clostridia bacterium]
IVIDLNDPTGWTMKNAEGKYEDVNYSPMNKDGQQVMTGGVRIDFPGNATINNYTIDYFGIFGSLDAAKAHVVREKAETISVITGKVEKAPVEEKEEPKEEEPKKPLMKDALTRGEDAALDHSITLVSAVPNSVVSDSALVYKFAKLGEYDDSKKKWDVLDDEATSYIQTWGSGTFEATSAGILKYTSNAAGGTLFEVHPKKSAKFDTHPYMVVGYKTNENLAQHGKIGYFYTSGNEYRLELDINMDSEWHYDLFNLKTLDTRVKEGNYKDKATDMSKVSLNAFRIDFPKAVGVVFYIDYVGFFSTEEEAKAYIAKSEKAVEDDKNATVPEEDKFTYMKGYEDGTFRPSAQMTRAEACTVVARLLADEEVIAADRATAFTDVKKGDWYYSYVTYLEELGYLPNYSGEFKPNQNITRGEFIKLAFEAGGLEFSMKRPDFTDLDNSHPYYKEIVFASGTGIVTGYNNGDGTMSFKPDGEITRAEIATVVNRILKIKATPDAAQEFSDLDNTHWAFGTIMAIAAAK